jgi:Regulator of chromosome condensation (RCC1) repeat
MRNHCRLVTASRLLAVLFGISGGSSCDPAGHDDADSASGGTSGSSGHTGVIGTGGSARLDAFDATQMYDGHMPVEAGIGPSMALGRRFGCALDSASRPLCWGMPTEDFGQKMPPGGAFSTISANFETLCALRIENGTIQCWGSAQGMLLAPPAGSFSAISLSTDDGACAISRSGRISCWGVGFSRAGGVSQLAPTLPSISIVSGSGSACVLLADRKLMCWGRLAVDTRSEATTFKMLSGSVDSFCALKDDGEIKCWGAGSPDDSGTTAEGNWGQGLPPKGPFTSIATGWMHSCGIRPDKSIECWGRGSRVFDCSITAECGQAIPPKGEFEEVAVSAFFSCGRHKDGNITCWGLDSYGRTAPPNPFP